MGRQRVYHEEHTTTITAYQAEAWLVEKFQKTGETRADSLRRIFLNQFGKEMVEEAINEVQKKLERQALVKVDSGVQMEIIDSNTGRMFKDIAWSQKEMIDIVIEAKELKGDLAKRNADDSLQRAINRGDAQRTEEGKYVIIRKWF